MSTLSAIPTITATTIDVRRVEGVFDGVAGAVLGLMERDGLPLEAAVEVVRRDTPTANLGAHLDGRVSALALAALCGDLWDTSMAGEEIATLGLAGLEPEDLARAAGLGQRYRLVGTATPHCATVELRRITSDHPLWAVTGPDTAVILHTATGSWLRETPVDLGVRFS